MKWKIVHTMPHAKTPTKAHEGDAAYDLFAAAPTVLINPGQWIAVPLGIAIEPPPGWWFEIRGRSSSLQNGFDIRPGVIDNGYRGDLYALMCLMPGFSSVRIETHQRVAQLIPHRVHDVAWQRVSALGESTRGTNGWGSSGR